MIRARITYLFVLLIIMLPPLLWRGVGGEVLAQNYNNAWINHNLKYYKIKVANDSLYKLDSLMLARAGVPTLNPNYLRFFQKGVELFAYVAGAADNVLNKNDYVLFYAERNKGRDDSLLYANVPYLTNPYYSVVNDTGAVFFTYDSSTVAKRLALSTDTNYALYPNPSPYYLKEVYSPRVDYCPGPYNAVNQNDPRWVLGEGFYSSQIVEQTSYTFSFNTSSSFTSAGAPVAYATVCFSGANDLAGISPDHIIQISLQGTVTQPLGTYSVSGYNSGKYTYALNPSDFTTSNTSINVSSLTNPLTSVDNSLNVNYIDVVYPQQFNMSSWSPTQEKIYLPDDQSGQGQSKLVISGFNNINNSQPVLLDFGNNKISLLSATSTFTALVPNTGGTKFCLLSSLAAADTVLSIKPVNGNGTFVTYPTLDSAFVIISHPKLINAPSTGVMDYANWRHSGVGGGNYNVIVASVEDLYDQFAYGVERNPIAIKNFCAWLIATNNKPPSNLFLIGKGVHSWEYLNVQQNGSGYFQVEVSSSAASAECLVPSFGFPSSDNLLTQGLPGSAFYPEPAIPTGRIAAQTDADVRSYLNKVELYVQQDPDSLWRKRAIHFIGGDSPSDQQNFISYMSGCKQTYLDTLIGGDVFSFYKTTTTPISTNTNDSVTLLINQGVSLMTFFGHGSQTGFDQNIDAPSAYNNSPKFPFIIANSCFTGDIFNSNTLTNSEEWILAPNNKGSIGYIATTAEGVANDLAIYTQELYNQFCYKNYGMPYGYCIKKDINYLMGRSLYSNDTLLQETCLEMTLEGDPAIRPNTIQKPDYTLTNSDVIFNTQKYPDSIGIKIIMTNLGKAIHTTYIVKVIRQFPNGVDSTYYRMVKAPLYKDTLSFFISKNYTQAVGLNSFTVTLNCLNTISEITFLNNSTTSGLSLFIQGSDIDPVWPYKYAIVPNIHNITLEASTANPLAPSTQYVFQLDTSASFSSPLLINQTVTAPGGVVSLPVRLVLNKDSVVYFWRVAKDSTTISNWKQSSFQVINGKYGWEQAHFRQFNNDTYQYVQYDSAHWRFNFANNIRTIMVKDLVTESQFDLTQVNFFLDNSRQRLWSCGPGGWSVAIFDTISGNPIPSYSVSIAPSNVVGYPTWIGNAGNCICDQYANKVTYDFGLLNQCLNTLDNNWARKMTTFIAGIPNGTPVLAYTSGGYYPGSSPPYNIYSTPPTPALKAALQSIGSIKIDSLSDTTTLIIFGRKGMRPGQAHEVLSRSAKQYIQLIDTLETHFDNGYIASEIIGPARQSDTAWKSLHWRYNLPQPITSSTGTIVPTIATDSIVVQLIGIDNNGIKTTLANFTRDSLDVLDLSHYTNQVPNKFFPYLQLIAYEKDNRMHRPPQLKRWQVIFDQAPECALYPSGGYTVANTTVSEGQNYQLVMPIKNIGAFPFPDSLVVNYYVQDVNRVTHTYPYQLKPKDFAPGSVILDTFNIPSMGLGGGNTFGIDVNTPGRPKFQPEQYHFNNIAQFSFNVNKDKINPILDVTFDGTHILNGDIVSSKPDILITLKDENKFLALNDTSNFTVYTTGANSTVQQRVYFNNPIIQFVPAVLPNNSCKINYKPILGQDGLYSLDVKASDRSKNQSGQVDYKIQYEVINKPMITEVLNYPNPFSTSTKFVFTITGSEVPQTLKIQIMTITGKVVKEITREELGYLHIGRNITEYAWDGKDQYGDKLANGVYFYHVVTVLNGSEVEHLNTSADEYFKKGVGKMVIMR
ncbi:MAG: putative type IX secretion system sortase PorU2 [Bacteroidia bacterium]